MDTSENAGMSLGALLETLNDRRVEVAWDGRNVRLRPPDLVCASVAAAVRRHREALVWMLRHRLPVDETRPAWEFWLRPEDWLDFCLLKAKGE